jgi:hypothetical protein
MNTIRLPQHKILRPKVRKLFPVCLMPFARRQFFRITRSSLDRYCLSNWCSHLPPLGVGVVFSRNDVNKLAADEEVGHEAGRRAKRARHMAAANSVDLKPSVAQDPALHQQGTSTVSTPTRIEDVSRRFSAKVCILLCHFLRT